MRRILFITSKPYHPWEGACHRTRSTLEALVALGYTVDLLTVPAGESYDATGVTLFFVPRLPLCRDLADGPSLRRFATDHLLFFKAVFLASRTSYALIHGVDDCGVIAWLAARLTKTPCVCERYADLDYAWLRGVHRFWTAPARFLACRALKRADAVIGSHSSIINLLSRFGRRSRACVIPDIPAVTNDVPLPARNLALARFKTELNQKLVTCVSSYSSLRGLELFFNAMPHVLASNTHVRFAVVGGSDHEIQRMRKALGKARIENAVVFAGCIPPGELAALLDISDVVVSPRRPGVTVPIKVLDYLRSGTPIVAADTPANRAVLSPDNAVITRATPEALADGILKLCIAPHIGDALGHRGKDTLVEENRTPEAFRNALRRCYDYVTADKAHA